MEKNKFLWDRDQITRKIACWYTTVKNRKW